jgi:uncharacterized protein
MASVTVLGRGVARTEPDEATVVLTVEAIRPSAAEALQDVSARAQALVALCDELGVESERRVTAGATVSERVEHDRDGRPQQRGYAAVNRLTVRVAEATTVAGLLQDAVARADARVDGPWWSIDLENPARLDACRAAATDARRRAEAYAAALGVRLGAMLSVREPGTGPPPGPEPRMGFARLAEADVAPPVEAGEQTVSAAVEVEFLLEQA